MSKRPLDERRRLLKTLLAGGAAAAGASALPDAWKKPVVDALVLPVHAQGSAPPFINTIVIDYSVTGAGAFNGSVTPATSPVTHVMTDALPGHGYAYTPTVIVSPGITDTFNLAVNEVVVGGDSTNFSPATQTLAPDPVNGVIPFNTIVGNVDNARYAEYRFTLTPSNPAFPTYYLQVTLDEAPAGPGTP